MTQDKNPENYFDIAGIPLGAVPFVFYKDFSGVYRGGNLNQARLFGFDHPTHFIGKTIFDILPDLASAQLIDQRDREVMSKGVPIISEDTVTTPQGIKTYLSQKQPIRNDDGCVIGLLGFAIDITDFKNKQQQAQAEKEKYQIEIDYYKKLTEQQSKFQLIANQVAHDIVSPLSALTTIISMLKDIPEKHRITLKQAAMRIEDIANDLLRNYQAPTTHVSSKIKDADIFFAYLGLREILSEKRVEYHSLPIMFTHQIEPGAYFAFIQADSKSFHRMLSNLVNNAVKAVEGKTGVIQIKLSLIDNSVVVTIIDNGRGMSLEMQNKILRGDPIVDDTKRQGIGLAQVHETLKQSNGTLAIESTEGMGTQIILTFPKARAPHWAATQLILQSDQTVLILDDDPFIHGAWELRFAQILAANPKIQLHHFTKGRELLDFVAPLSKAEISKLYLLSDHELIDQEMHGLMVIDQAKLTHATLVTSHYKNSNVLAYASQLHVPVLPKRLASKVPIKIVPTNDQAPLRDVDIVLLDDSQVFADSIIFRLSHRKIAHYLDPRLFIAEREEYARDTPICIDNHFGIEVEIDGMAVAEQLHAMGFTRLYIISGAYFDPDTLPSYVTLIRKMNLGLLDTL